MFKNGVGLTEVEIDVDGRLAAGSFLRHTSQSQQWTKPRSDPHTKPHNTLTKYFLKLQNGIARHNHSKVGSNVFCKD